MKKRSQKQYTSPLQNPMMTMMLIMLGCTLQYVESRKVYIPPEILTWILSQEVKPYTDSSGVTHHGTVQEWHDYFQQWNQEEWASWMSTQYIAGKKWMKEEWLEWWTSPEGSPLHEIEHTLTELREHSLIAVLRNAAKVVKVTNRRAALRYKPY